MTSVFKAIKHSEINDKHAFQLLLMYEAMELAKTMTLSADDLIAAAEIMKHTADDQFIQMPNTNVKGAVIVDGDEIIGIVFMDADGSRFFQFFYVPVKPKMNYRGLMKSYEDSVIENFEKMLGNDK